MQGIDLVAGGKSKKSKRTAPKSDDIYLKLLVKVPHLPLSLSLSSLYMCGAFALWLTWIAYMWTAVPFSGAEDREQFQCGDTEEALHEQGQQAAIVSLQVDSFHEGQGTSLSLSLSVSPRLCVCIFYLVAERIEGKKTRKYT